MFYLIKDENPNEFIAHGSAKDVIKVAKPIWDNCSDDNIFEFFIGAIKEKCSAISFGGYELGFE